MSNQERYHGLDFVRAMAMILGVVIHTVGSFGADINAGGGSGEYEGSHYNSLIGETIHLFRMQLFFLLAGFFAELVREKRGIKSLMCDRIKRIVLPVLIGLLLMVPFIWALTGWSAGGVYTNTYDGLSWLDRYKTALLWGTFTDRSISPVYDLWHFWFVYFLMYYYIIHWLFSFLGEKDFLFKNNRLLIYLVQNSVSKKNGFFLLGILCFPIHYSLQSPLFYPSGFNFQVNELLYYFVYYLFGVYLFKNKSLLGHLSKNCWYYLILSLPFALAIHEPTIRHDLMNNVVVDITSWNIATIHIWGEGVLANGYMKVVIVAIRCTVSWTLCLSFIGLAQRYLSSENKYTRYLADSAYWVYWIHPLFTLPLAKAAHQLSFVNSMVKSFAVLYLTMFLMYLLYNKFIRYTFLGDFFMSKRKNKSDNREQSFTIYNLTKITLPSCFALLLVSWALGSLSYNKTKDCKYDILVESLISRDKNKLKDCVSVSTISDRFGRTTLHSASYAKETKRRYNPIPIILSKGADVDAVDFVGRTSLFYSVRTGNIADIKILIKAGADLNISDKYGHTPLHVAAIKAGHKNKKTAKIYFTIFQLLKEKGAELKHRDYKGRTPEDCLNYFSGNRFKRLTNTG